MQQLTSQIQEVAQATGEMAAGVQSVAASAEEQAVAIEEVTHTAGSLAEMADQLNGLVSRFKA